ncbi:integrin alpha-7 isoform X2 [Bombina bombina]|uniref:integrin alpha-7 isoform X2 n=1 Tax=Bombina bombina TaxID=8345 RepID=UPI00235B2CCB|nr:integrin alpha-7 isoform X2 [Bombina bombina]
MTAVCWDALLFFSCFSLLALDRTHAFNLDITHTLQKDGEQGSLFGFSVALHKQLRPVPKSWILVGAPQALGLPGQRAKKTGALYGCPLTNERNDCKRVDMDSGEDTSRESKENQWLGVTVKSQGLGGKIVTCAHLYESRQRVTQPSETRDVIGRCFVLSEDLTISEDLDGGEWKFCEGRPQGHEMFGFCQQGMSAGFTSDNHYILFGAPGTYNWKGEMRVELFNQSVLDLGTYDDGPYEVAGENSQKPELIPLPFNSYLGLLFVTNIDSSDPDQLVYKTLEPREEGARLAPDVALNSYLGFSLDSGWGLTGRNKLSFVSGAPRANHTGAVVILRRDSGSQLVPEVTLWGETVASSFGYSVVVEDLNNDGWTDLLVGAPNFFSRKDELGGAVYIYMNQAGTLDRTPSVRLNGREGSMFGIAICSLGDINQDGFKDVAVGAPFDGDGKVYIYLGSQSGLVTKEAQILDGVSVAMKTFGYSLSGGLDIDGNTYPDLVVGSLSDTIVFYRSRPVIRLQKDITVEPQNIDLQQNNCGVGNGVCVHLRACFSYSALPVNYNPRITLECVFEAEADRRSKGKPSRVTFLSRQSSDPEYQSTKTVELQRQSTYNCVENTFQIQEGIKDKLRSIPVSVTYNIRQARGKRQSSADTLPPLMPVLSAEDTNVYTTEVNFLREGCGEDKICQSNLRLNYTFCSRVNNTKQFEPLPIENNVPVFSLTDQKDIALKITITNFPSDHLNPSRDGDDAHEAQLILTVPSTMFYSTVRPVTDKLIVCTSNVNASQATCELGYPMKRNAEISFYLVISIPGITLETTELEVNLELTTISEQPNLRMIHAIAKVIFELPLVVSGFASPDRLYYSGEVKGESAMKTEEDVGSALDIKVTVSNRGQPLPTLGSAFLNLMWPHELMNGKWLLYPMNIFLSGGQQHGRIMQCAPTYAINPLNLTSANKQEDQVPSSARRWPLTFPAKKKDIVLDCAQGTARCVVFQCPLYSFHQVELNVRGRLWNSTFLEDYSSVSNLKVIIRANITVKSSIKNLELRNATAQIPVILYSDVGVAILGGVPWWIILIAVLGGILLLALLVLILWKCGFFKRSTREEKYSTNYYRAHLGVQPSEADRQAEEEI